MQNDKTKDNTGTDSSRRRFIAGLTAVGGLAATGAAVSGSNSPAMPADGASAGTSDPMESVGYQHSAHVQAYYRSLKD